jgi:hypothetical protein
MVTPIQVDAKLMAHVLDAEALCTLESQSLPDEGVCPNHNLRPLIRT